MSTESTSRVGETLGPYRLEFLLGRGGMGEVYRAHDTVRDRVVALKLLPRHLAGDPEFQERFRRECQTVARLDEPHVIPIHDFGELDGQLYLDMRLVNGRDLRAIVNERGVLSPAEALAFIEQIAAAVDAAHAAGLVHRDVKPENVLVTAAGFAYLVDFGVAHADTDTHLTKTGTAIGSIAYMAPEQFDNRPTSPAVDVYALAAVFFELVTGRKPYPGDSVSVITRGILFEPVPRAELLNPTVPTALGDVLAWGLAKDPAQRCPSATELVRAARAASAAVGPAGAGDARRIATVHAPRQSGPGGSSPAPVEATALAPTHYRHVAPPPTPNYSAPGYSVAAPPASTPPAAPVPPGRRNTGALVAIAVLAVALIGLGAWFLVDRSSRNTESTAASSTTSETAPARETTTLTATETTRVTSAVTTPATKTPAAKTPPLPAGAKPCPDDPGVATHQGRKTSCEFAVSVRDAYFAAGPAGGSRVVNGWAPTQQAYVPMACGPADDIVICTGGTQSIVYLY